MTELRTFRDMLERAAPPWLLGFWGSRLLYAIGTPVDALIDGVTQAIKARFPGFAPPDGLPLIGQDRGVVRGFAEPDASYAQRLTQWIDDRKSKGSPYATMRQLRGYFTGYSVPMRGVNQLGDWHSLDAAGADSHHRSSPRNWDWDGDDTRCTRYWVILTSDAGGPFAHDGIWDDPGTWDDGGTWDSTASPEQVATVRAIVKVWNPPHSRCAGIIVSFDDSEFAPDGVGSGYPSGNWGTWGHLNAGNYEAVRLGTVSYWDGI